VVIWPSDVLPWETGNDDDVALIQKIMNDFRRNVLNLCLGMNAVGNDAGLRARERDGGDADGMQAMAASAMVVCSPVARRTSISRIARQRA